MIRVSSEKEKSISENFAFFRDLFASLLHFGRSRKNGSIWKNENFAKNTEFLKQMQNVIEKFVKIHQKRLKF